MASFWLRGLWLILENIQQNLEYDEQAEAVLGLLFQQRGHAGRMFEPWILLRSMRHHAAVHEWKPLAVNDLDPGVVSSLDTA